MVYPASLVPSLDGKRLLMHASGSKRLHGDKSAYLVGNQSSLLTYGLRKDGFVALSPSGGAPGVLVMRPMRWGGGELSLNANCTGTPESASIRVELRGADGGKALQGYGFADSTVFASDSLGWRVAWGPRTMGGLGGKVLTVAVELRGRAARLYAVRGRWAEPAEGVSARWLGD